MMINHKSLNSLEEDIPHIQLILSERFNNNFEPHNKITWWTVFLWQALVWNDFLKFRGDDGILRQI
jgi:hypothetical protein